MFNPDKTLLLEVTLEVTKKMSLLIMCVDLVLFKVINK